MSNIKFIEKSHQYLSLDGMLEFTSVTKLIGKYKPKFDENIAYQVVKNKKSKWYGLDPLLVQEIWKKEGERSATDGTLFHNNEEKILTDLGKFHYNNIELPVYTCSINEQKEKLSMNQILKDGIYPEFIVYMLSILVAGQIDKLIVSDGCIHIEDYKTNKEIKRSAFRKWDGSYETLNGVLSHVENCEFYIYALQLSIYMYILLRHNRKLKFGSLKIEHIKFQIESEDEYGYPTYKKDTNGIPIVESREFIELPYMKDEVVAIFKDIKL